jgi:hypothetical protein
MVRGAASFAVGQFAEHLQPEIVSHHESVLPCFLNALEDASNEVKVNLEKVLKSGINFYKLLSYTSWSFSTGKVLLCFGCIL